jgi:hypothetical protein
MSMGVSITHHGHAGLPEGYFYGRALLKQAALKQAASSGSQTLSGYPVFRIILTPFATSPNPNTPRPGESQTWSIMCSGYCPKNHS